MRKLKIAFISFAHGHAFSYLDGFRSLAEVEIVGIADEVEHRVAEIVKRYGIPYYNDYRELLQEDFDAVVICSENVHHAKHTIASAQAGKHILCEKPLGISVAEMEHMIAIARAQGVQLMTAFPCRSIAAVVSAKKAVDRGDIGQIIAIKGTNRGTMPGGWFIDVKLSGGGALLDHTVNVMDLMNWFTGSRVEEVNAYTATRFHEQLEVEDVGMLHVKFENGVFGILDTSWSRSKSFPTWGDVTMEIIGTKGIINVDSFAQSNELYCDDNGKGTWEYWGQSMDDFMIKSFVDALLHHEAVPITGEDGLRSAQVALAGYESANYGRPVRIDR